MCAQVALFSRILKIIDILQGVRYNGGMNYLFNAEKIKKLLLHFYISTGIAVTFYDSDANMVATSPVYSEFCHCIREQKECVAQCNLSDRVHMKQASERKQTVPYACHAGLMETILPVFYEDTLIGYMQIGQFKDADKIHSSEQSARLAALEYGLCPDKAMDMYEKLPTVSAEKLDALQEILLLLIKSFWEDGLIRHKRSMLSVRIEQYITEHLREKLYVEAICEQFFLSKNALYRLFANEFGMTVGEYILEKRLQLAMQLLRKTTASVTQVALECGFTDHNYFIRAFKKKMGITPLQFRKSK